MCPPVATPPPPTTVSELHPAHVSLVMAMGDSITAAFAARSTPYEDRDMSWSIGRGSAKDPTLPWLLSAYTNTTHPLEGFSTKAEAPKDILNLPHDDYHPSTDALNVAESMAAVSLGSLDEQWGFLSSALGSYADVDERWKVFTLLIGANDVCDKCDAPISDAFLSNWTAGVSATLGRVASGMRRVYVNLVPLLDLSSVARLQRDNLFCHILHDVLKECGCVRPKATSAELAQLDQNVHTLTAALGRIASEWTQRLTEQGRTDMAVVFQPFMANAGARMEIDFLSGLDCFHPSRRGHRSIAIGLWNSMLCHERQTLCGGAGPDFPPPDLNATCPTSASVFYTPKAS